MVKGFFHRLKLGLARNLVLDLSRHSAFAAEELRGIIRAARPEEDDARDRRLESLADKLALMDAALTALTLRADQFEPAVTHHLAHLSYCLEGPVGRAAETLERINRVADAVDALHHTVERQGTTTNLLSKNLLPKAHRRIRVVFLINYMQAWDSLAEIHAAMVAADDFDVTVATIPGRHDEHVAHEALLELQVSHLRLVQDAEDGLRILKSLEPDVIFRQHPWDAELPESFRTENLGFARLCYVPYYGMQVLEDFGQGDQGHNLHTDQPFHRACWRIFCENQAIFNIYRDTSALAGRNAVVVGHPKLTRLANMRTADPYWPVEAQGERRAFRIIWAPHHSVGNEWMNFGSFPIIMNDMLAWAQRESSIEFVLRPHPSLFGFMRSGEWTVLVTPEQFEHFLAAWTGLPNTAVDELASYAPLFVASDLMITDGISFLTEYQIFDKPLVFFERPEHAPFNEVGKLIASGTLRVNTFAELLQVIESYRQAGSDPSAKVRREVVKKIVSAEDPAKKILAEIRAGVHAGD